MRDGGHFVLCLCAVVMLGCGAGSATTKRHGPAVTVPTASARRVLLPPPVADLAKTQSDAAFAELHGRYADSSVLERHHGWASYYSDSLIGHPTASGQAYDPRLPTMAHRTLPFGSIVRVVRVSTGAEVIVRVTDRGPYGKKRRIADISGEAARRLDMIQDGVVEVRLDVLSLGGDGTQQLRRRH